MFSFFGYIYVTIYHTDMLFLLNLIGTCFDGLYNIWAKQKEKRVSLSESKRKKLINLLKQNVTLKKTKTEQCVKAKYAYGFFFSISSEFHFIVFKMYLWNIKWNSVKCSLYFTLVTFVTGLMIYECVTHWKAIGFSVNKLLALMTEQMAPSYRL